MHSLLPPRWQVPKEFHRRLGEKAGTQRAMLAEGHLLLILHKAPKPGESERAHRIFWRNPEGTWQSSDGSAGVAELLEHLTEYERAVDQLESNMCTATKAEDYFQILTTTTPLLRAARNQHTALQHAREGIANDAQLIGARDGAAEIERTLELLNADATHAMQFLVASRAEEQAQNSEQIAVSSQRLNLLIALFLPLTAAASVLGMNVKTGLENQPISVFWLVVVACVVLGLVTVGLVAAPTQRKPENKPRDRAKKRR